MFRLEATYWYSGTYQLVFQFFSSLNVWECEKEWRVRDIVESGNAALVQGAQLNSPLLVAFQAAVSINTLVESNDATRPARP